MYAKAIACCLVGDQLPLVILPIFSSPLRTAQPFLPIALPSIERPTNFFLIPNLDCSSRNLLPKNS